MKTMIDMLESMRSTSDLFPEDLRYGLEPGTKKPRRTNEQDVEGCKKTTNSRENPPVKGGCCPR
ncbi:MAG: hypothetical protein METHP_00684 [Methanoregula sp. SKADARSKE-2]|nr:MAG: hypothetical protein METHP_00684 [Methanoregula sp. SKADARSKE-2]